MLFSELRRFSARETFCHIAAMYVKIAEKNFLSGDGNDCEAGYNNRTSEMKPAFLFFFFFSINILQTETCGS